MTGGQSLIAQPVKIDKVIAIVDGAIILQSELIQRQTLINQQILEQNLAAPPEEELREQILDQLITENLQMQVAERAGIRIDDNMLNETMTSIAQQNNMTFDQFRQVLEAQNAYLSTREQLRKEMTINQVQGGAVNQRINITRQEIENYLRSEAGLSNIAPEFHVAHVLIPTSGVATSRQEELASALYERIKQGDNILEIASSRVISTIPVSGGDLPWGKVETLPSAFQTVVPTLSAGEVSEPFTSANGFHIVQVLEKRGGVDLTLDQSHLRHILISPNEIRTDQQAEQLIRQLYDRILAGEDFADIARQNTDDSNSMVAGGDLDWVSRIDANRIPTEVISLGETATLGELTEPFQSPVGWHILEVLERRIEDITEVNKDYMAEQALRQRKYDMELENWLTEIRDTAFIDIKSDEN